MLRGNSETRIDDKGRLKIPAVFKKVLDEEFADNKFFITSVDGQTARVYPRESWLKVEAILNTKLTPATTDLKFRFNYWGGEAEMDAQARVLVPQVLREKAGIAGEVSVMGMNDFLEVCTSEKAKQRGERELTPEERAQASEMGI